MTITNAQELSEAIVSAGHAEFVSKLLDNACPAQVYSGQDGLTLFFIETHCVEWSVFARRVGDIWEIDRMESRKSQ